MYVSITFHPNRDEWRSLFLTESEAAADAAKFLALFPDQPVTARVEPAAFADAAEYVERADESYAECAAEAGSGAMSLGYGVDGAYEAANAVERPSSDPLYIAAVAMLSEARAAADPEPSFGVGVYPAGYGDDDLPF